AAIAAVTSSLGSSESSLNSIFGVIGSGDAKISASTTAFTSAETATGVSSLTVSLVIFHGQRGTGPVLRTRRGIVDRVRRVRRPRPFVDANGPDAARLEHANQ